MYACIKNVRLADAAKLRSRGLNALWLGTIGKYKLNSHVRLVPY